MSLPTFRTEIANRFKIASNSRFIMYSIFVYIGGALGIFFTWYEVANEDSVQYPSFKVAEGIATFFVPLVGACIAEIFISPKIINKIAFYLLSLIVYGGSIALLWWTYHQKDNYAFWPAFLGVLLSIFYWIIAYADEDKFDEENFFNQMRGNYDRFKRHNP